MIFDFCQKSFCPVVDFFEAYEPTSEPISKVGPLLWHSKEAQLWMFNGYERSVNLLVR